MYIGFKEKKLAKLIGFTYALKILIELEIKKIRIHGHIFNMKKIFNGYFDEEDPFLEKVVVLCRNYMNYFEILKIDTHKGKIVL